MSKIAEAMALVEARFSDYYFNFGRGRCSQDEPLYGFCLYAPDYSSADGPPLISAEHDDPMECIRMAIEKFGTLPPAKQNKQIPFKNRADAAAWKERLGR